MWIYTYLYNTPHVSPDDEGSMFLWNVCNTTHYYMVQAPKSRMNINLQNEESLLFIIISNINNKVESAMYIWGDQS
jgi:hypothetical protein